MRVFLDFEASSLGKHGYPIEVGWVFEDGRGEDMLIRPAPNWTDWDAEAAAVHGISRESLLAEGAPHDEVARRIVAELSGHALYASAPSWDGKWLSTLLRAGGFTRHALRLRDTEELFVEAARQRLGFETPGEAILELVGRAREIAEAGPVAHRALQDAERERAIWLAVASA